MTQNKLKDLCAFARIFAMENPSSTRHVSIIIRKNRIISIGLNYGKSNPNPIKMGYFSPIMHSELAAFRKVPYTIRSKLTLVNFRFNKRGELRESCPCKICASWCYEVFKNIYASNSFDDMIQWK